MDIFYSKPVSHLDPALEISNSEVAWRKEGENAVK